MFRLLWAVVDFIVGVGEIVLWFVLLDACGLVGFRALICLLVLIW